MPGFEEGVALAALLSVIPAERREAFVLTQVLGLGYAEAAAAVGCPAAPSAPAWPAPAGP